MKLFPFQEAFKSGSSVCPHRKFLCFNFPKKEISLRIEPSICLWVGLLQETGSWVLKTPLVFLLLLGCQHKKLSSHPGGGDPTETDPGPPLPPSSSFSCALAPSPPSCVTPRALILQEGFSTCNFHQAIGVRVDLSTSHTLTNGHPTAVAWCYNTNHQFLFPLSPPLHTWDFC